ncbi:hypothetical protein CAEBREN_25402 [Caenorhabditis brenneri]|uniref:Domain of unknown function WSN domain-containing protein n=1 Tax=Caenorhabditis brenneri TaxID=135651 RepID=G0MJE9_CAEBE|nr:hypothetical protein CAEBREN_25402 [Caenorhabditis brenneri]
MRDHLRLLSLLFVTWLTLCDSKFVDPLATAVLPPTRIVGTVSMYKKICEKEELVTDVVCELVDVDKTVYGELTKKNLDSQVKAINAASKFFEKTSTVDLQNSDKTLQGFGMLVKLKEHEDKLKGKFIDEARIEIERSIAVSTTILIKSRNIDKETFEKIEEDLKSIDKEDVNDSNMKKAIKHLRALHGRVVVFREKLKAIQNYETAYSDFMSFKGLDTTTKAAIEVVTAIKSIFDNFDSTKVFDSMVPALKYRKSKLNIGFTEIEKHATALSSIESSLPLIDRLSTSKSKKSITGGLPKGAMDLKGLFADMNSTWFVNNLVRGRNTESLQSFLSTIPDSSSSLENAQVRRFLLSSDQNIQKNYSDFAMNVTELVVIGKKAENSLEVMIPCARMLKKLSNEPDLKNVDEVANYVGIFVKLVKDFEKLAEEIRSIRYFTSFQENLEKLLTVFYPIMVHPTLNQTVTVWEDIRKLKLLTKYDEIWKALQKFPESPFYLSQEDLPTSILTDALKIAQDANIFEAVKCFPSTATSVTDVIHFTQKFSELKEEKSKLKAVIPTLTSALAFSNSASTAMKKLKATKSNENVGFICDLPEEFNKNVQPFLMTGDLISDLAKIEKSAAAIQKVSSPNDGVKQEIENIPGSEFYNDQYRKALTDSWNTIKNTIQSITAGKTYEDLAESVDFFLPKIRKVVVKDLEKLKDPIATELSKNSDEKMKEAAKFFETVSDLNMNFTSYSGIALEMDFVESLSVLFRPKRKAEQTIRFIPTCPPIPVMNTWVGAVVLFSGFGVVALVVSLCSCFFEKLKKEQIEAERRNNEIGVPPPSFVYEEKMRKSKITSSLPKGNGIKKGDNVDLEKGKGGKNGKNKEGGNITPKENKSESKEKTATTPSAESAALPATTSSSAEASSSNAGTPSPAAAK